MTAVFSACTRYLAIIFIGIYMILCFTAISDVEKKTKRKIFYRQAFLITLIYGMYSITAYLKTKSVKVLGMCAATFLLYLLLGYIFVRVYPRSNKFLLLNIWLMLLTGSIMLIRISYTKAERQFLFSICSIALALIVPVIISKIKILRHYSYCYAVLGIIMLAMVLFMADVTYGAKISFDLKFFTIQPSEFVKITYPMFVAGILYRDTSVKNIVISTVLCGIHIILLVLSKDLGSALIFSVAFLFMVYVATGKKSLLLGGLLAGICAAFLAYKIFYHVQVRVAAWVDPWSIIDDKGYQIAQSIFAIGTGSLFGMGLYDGNPNYIPVVQQDFIFSAISEEMGGFFALELILLYFATFVIMFQIALKCRDEFYKLTCFGMAVIYGTQVFLTVGGAIKLIPSTGVTLPLISYGGSSLVSTMIMFSIIQGFNIYDAKGKQEQIIEKTE